MTLKYLLFEKDYLENQLYYASRSQIAKKYKRGTINNAVLTITMITVYFFILGNFYFLLWFILFCVVFLIIAPFMALRRLKKAYQNSIAQLFKNRFGLTSTVEFKSSSIIDSDSMRVSEISHSALQSVEETGTYFFIWTKYGENLIIPKSEVDKDAVKNYLHQLAEQIKIPYNSDLSWKWK